VTALSIAAKIEEAYEYHNGNGQIGKTVVVPKETPALLTQTKA
jgi:hypothetical protein